MSSDRVEVLDALRGLAALSVCWFHVTNGNPTHLPDGWVKASGSAGWLGVDVFFVISGFVIPLSMRRGGFQPRQHFGRFLAKRLVRLEPPYLASLTLVLALGWTAAQLPGFRGAPFEPTWGQVGAHLGYLNAFVGLPWLNPVYWTLAIEFQFYFLVAMSYAAISSDRAFVRLAAVPVLLAIGCLSAAPSIVLLHIPLFALGIAAFQVRERLLGRVLGWGVIVLAAGIGLLRIGTARTLVGVATALAILFVQAGVPRALVRLGDVSYSLYLVHVPIGGRVINVLDRIVPEGGLRIGGSVLAALLSLLAAAAFWTLVERPARRWASRIRYMSAAATGRVGESVASQRAGP